VRALARQHLGALPGLLRPPVSPISPVSAAVRSPHLPPPLTLVRHGRLRTLSRRDAINATGRPMYVAVNGITHERDATLRDAASVANTVRTFSDDYPDFQIDLLPRIMANNFFAEIAHPGYFNDADMLEVGNLVQLGFPTEAQTQFSLWSLVKSPLIIGTDLTNMSDVTVRILSNHEAIAVNQDPLGVQGVVVWRSHANVTKDSYRHGTFGETHREKVAAANAAAMALSAANAAALKATGGAAYAAALANAGGVAADAPAEHRGAASAAAPKPPKHKQPPMLDPENPEFNVPLQSVWAGPLVGGDFAVILLNAEPNAANITLSRDMLQLVRLGGRCRAGALSVSWTGESVLAAFWSRQLWAHVFTSGGGARRPPYFFAASHFYSVSHAVPTLIVHPSVRLRGHAQAIDAAAKAGVKLAPPVARYEIRDINKHVDLKHRVSKGRPFTALVDPGAVLFLRLRDHNVTRRMEQLGATHIQQHPHQKTGEHKH
jgi:hypothetical protein